MEEERQEERSGPSGQRLPLRRPRAARALLFTFSLASQFGYGFFRVFGIRERRFRAPAAICGSLQLANKNSEEGPGGTASVANGVAQHECNMPYLSRDKQIP